MVTPSPKPALPPVILILMNNTTFYPVTQARGSNVTLVLSLPYPQITMLLTSYKSPPYSSIPSEVKEKQLDTH